MIRQRTTMGIKNLRKFIRDLIMTNLVRRATTQKTPLVIYFEKSTLDVDIGIFYWLVTFFVHRIISHFCYVIMWISYAWA